MSLTLFYHPLASYCHKVMVALHEHGIEADKRLINLGDEADRAELRSVWPLTKFPVLRDSRRGRDLAEASIIVEYLDHHYGGDRKLVPQDWDAALDARLWDRVFDNYVQGPVQAIVGDRLRGANADMSAERATLDTAYRMIDKRMAGRTWIAGDAFSMADCAAVPALFYAGTLLAFPRECANLQGYFERLMARPSVIKMLDEARPYFGMYPFAEDIPARFK